MSLTSKGDAGIKEQIRGVGSFIKSERRSGDAGALAFYYQHQQQQQQQQQLRASTFSPPPPIWTPRACAATTRNPQKAKKLDLRGDKSWLITDWEDMYQGFSGDFDSASHCSSSPSEPQYLSSVDSFSQSVGSPTTAAQECTTGVGEMPGSFVPTLTAITTSQDLQWMVQPTVISTAAQSQSQLAALPQPSMDPYNLPGTSYSTPGMCSYSRAGPSRPSRSSRPRRAADETLTAEEEEKRRVRRERNKLAAAKCRNRRRELTDRLQSETDQLEEEKAELQSQIAELHKEKERLELVLVAHRPGCKLPQPEAGSPQAVGGGTGTVEEVSSLAMARVLDGKEQPFCGSYPSGCQLAAEVPGAAGSLYPHCEPIHPALFNGCGSSASYTSSFVFTYPEGSSCGLVHQRNSSSDQSSDSLNSPSLLAL